MVPRKTPQGRTFTPAEHKEAAACRERQEKSALKVCCRRRRWWEVRCSWRGSASVDKRRRQWRRKQVINLDVRCDALLNKVTRTLKTNNNEPITHRWAIKKLTQLRQWCHRLRRHSVGTFPKSFGNKRGPSRIPPGSRTGNFGAVILLRRDSSTLAGNCNQTSVVTRGH